MQIDEIGRGGEIAPTLEDFEAYWHRELERVTSRSGAQRPREAPREE